MLTATISNTVVPNLGSILSLGGGGGGGLEQFKNRVQIILDFVCVFSCIIIINGN